MSEDEIIHMLQSYVGMSKKDNHRPILDKAIETLLDLYNIEKEKNRQSKMRIVQLEKEIDARIEDVNTYYINKDKIKEILDTYRYTKIEDTGKIIEFYKKIQKLLEEN